MILWDLYVNIIVNIYLETISRNKVKQILKNYNLNEKLEINV
jgi:hypothetical protein